MGRSRRSPVWDHFKSMNGPDRKALCCHCESVVSHRGNTTNLIVHLRIHHSSIHAVVSPLLNKKKRQRRNKSNCSRRLLDENMDSDSADGLGQEDSDSTSPNDGLHVEPGLSLTDEGSNANATSLSQITVTAQGSTSSSDTDNGRIEQPNSGDLYPARGSRMVSIMRAIMLFIVRGMQPLSLIDDQHFNTLVKELDPRIKLPCRSTVTNSLLPKLYEEAKAKLEAELPSVVHVALTADGWTSRNGEPYITVTIHFVNSSLKFITRVLNTSYFPVAHTSQNICDFLREVAKKWKILDKIVAVVTDNAANMKEAIRLAGWLHVPCFAHTLNLVVTDAFNSNHELKQLLSRCRSLVTYFKQSAKATAKLKELAGSNSKKTLKQEVVTRWNSTVTMIKSIVELIDSVNATLALHKRQDLMLDERDIQVLQGAIKILEPFEEATIELSSQTYPSLSKVIPVVRLLMQSLEHEDLEEEEHYFVCLHLLKSDLSSNLNSRFGNMEDTLSKVTATYLDPRYKKAYFKKASSAAEQQVERELRRARDPFSVSVAPSVLTDRPAKDHRPNLFRELHKATVREKNASRMEGLNVTASAILLLKEYNEWPLVEDIDPLKWWRAKKRDGLMAAMIPVVTKFFCIPATSVPSEQIFSKAGLLISDLRNRLKTSNVDMLIFLNKNA